MKLLPAKELIVILLVTLLWIAAVFNLVIKLDEPWDEARNSRPIVSNYEAEKADPLPRTETIPDAPPWTSSWRRWKRSWRRTSR